MIRIKRAYELPSRTDGTRVLVDRLWPRGCTREALAAFEQAPLLARPQANDIDVLKAALRSLCRD